MHKDGLDRADFVEHCRLKFKGKLKKKIEHYARIANKSKKEVI